MQPIAKSTSESRCPECDTPVPDSQVEGLCPRCLLGTALQFEGTDRQSTTGTSTDLALLSGDVAGITALPRSFGDYELVEEVARGGMGLVYKARQKHLHRWVALKMILAGPLASRSSVARFQQEAETVAALRHPGIVTIYEMGEFDGQHYLAMEYIEGASLAHRVRKGPIAYAQAAEWIRQMAEAVDHAHAKKVLHRDLKPSNVLIDATLQAHITDFGLAKTSESDSDLTATGAILGTPSYMPPEQAKGESNLIGPASDVYALGAILFEMLTGRPPFQGPTAVEILKQTIERDPVSPRTINPSVPPDLETICLKCLEKKTDHRYLSARELACEMERYLTNQPILARPVGYGVRLWRWTRRYPREAGLATALILALAVTAIVSTAAAARIAWAQHEAEIQRRRAENNAVRLHDHLAQSYVANGMAILDQGDAALSLPWLINALAMDERIPARATLHRIRLASVWKQLPTLAHVLVHDGNVNHVEFSPQSDLLASSSNDRKVRLWDLGTGRLKYPPLKHVGDVSFVFFSPDGKKLVSTSDDHTARIWDAATGRPAIDPLLHGGPVNYAGFSPNSKLVVTASSDRTARIWDAASGKQVFPPLPHDGAVERAQFSLDGHRLVTASTDGAARVWDLTTGKLIGKPYRHASRVTWASFSPEGNRLVTASADHTARVWNLSTGQPITAPLRHEDFVYQARFSPDGKRIATASVDQYARLWDARTGELIGKPMRHQGVVMQVVFSSDGQRLLTASNDEKVRVWNALTGSPLLPVMHHNSWVRQATFSHDGRQIASASGDRCAKVWDLTPATGPDWNLATSNQWRDVQFSPDGRFVLTAGVDPQHHGMACLWDRTTGQFVRQIAASDKPSTRARFSPDGRALLIAGESGVIQLSAATIPGAKIRTIDFGSPIYAAGFSAGGDRLFAATGPGMVPGSAQVWDVSTLRAVTPKISNRNSIFSAALNGPGNQLLLALGRGDASSGEGWAEVRDIATGNLALPKLSHQREVLQARFSSDDRWIATASADQTVCLWDAKTGRKVHPPLRHVGWVAGVNFSPDSRRLATYTMDQTARIWDVATGQPVTAAMKHEAPVTLGNFSPDGRFLLTLSDGRVLRVWDTSTGQAITPQLRYTGFVTAAVFAPDNRSLAAANLNGEVFNYALEPIAGTAAALTTRAQALCGRQLDPSGGLTPLGAEDLQRLVTARQ
jgi:eukaryotic-like serine/threonine-protein kinase